MKPEMPKQKRARLLALGGTLLGALLLAPRAQAADAMWLQGVYYDNMNKLSLKEGIAFMGTPIPHKDAKPWPYSDVPFTNADVEGGGEGYKLTLGRGMLTGPEMPVLPRIGVSYAHFRTQNLAGVEAVFSSGIPATEETWVPLGFSLKIGYYVGLAGTPNRLLVGMGIGL
jgi:hypothetical protein